MIDLYSIKNNQQLVFAAFVLMAISVSGCSTTNIQQYSSLDKSSKTMTVPPGGSGLNGKIKTVLAADGWKLLVQRGPRVTEGTFGETTRLEEFNTFNYRYTLYLDWRRYDWCFDFEELVSYDISLVDNENGSEVLTMGGRGCVDEIAEEFLKALD